MLNNFFTFYTADHFLLKINILWESLLNTRIREQNPVVGRNQMIKTFKCEKQIFKSALCLRVVNVVTWMRCCVTKLMETFV